MLFPVEIFWLSCLGMSVCQSISVWALSTSNVYIFVDHKPRLWLMRSLCWQYCTCIVVSVWQNHPSKQNLLTRKSRPREKRYLSFDKGNKFKEFTIYVKLLRIANYLNFVMLHKLLLRCLLCFIGRNFALSHYLPLNVNI